jgi:hypothetical protein
MPRSPTCIVEPADPSFVLVPEFYVPTVTALPAPCSGLNSVPSRQMANKMPAIFLASATTAVALPLLAAILVAHAHSIQQSGRFKASRRRT